jgi:hypothetical protein
VVGRKNVVGEKQIVRSEGKSVRIQAFSATGCVWRVLLDKGMGWISERQPVKFRARKVTTNDRLSRKTFF